jgi:hypothetical protein
MGALSLSGMANANIFLVLLLHVGSNPLSNKHPSVLIPLVSAKKKKIEPYY